MSNKYQVVIRARNRKTLRVYASILIYEHADRERAERQLEHAHEDHAELISRIRMATPDTVISTEMVMPGENPMADFPGESDALDHGATVLRVQAALGCTTTGWISPDVILMRIQQLKACIDPARKAQAFWPPGGS